MRGDSDLCSTAPLNGLEEAEATRGKDPSHPAYATVFDNSPYRPACAVWGMRPDRPQPSYPNAGIPLLLLSGNLDSFSPPGTTRTGASGLGPQVHVLEIPDGTHNVLGFSECAITARNDWARRTTEPPPGNACAGTPPIHFR